MGLGGDYGEVGGDFVDGGGDVVVFEDLPEWSSLAEEGGVLLRGPGVGCEGDGPVAGGGVGDEFGEGIFGEEVWSDAVGVAAEEIEDGMGAGIGAGDEIGPGDWAEGGHGSLEGEESAGGSDGGEVGEFALFDEGVGEGVVHAVDTEDDDAVGCAWNRGSGRGGMWGCGERGESGEGGEGGFEDCAAGDGWGGGIGGGERIARSEWGVGFWRVFVEGHGKATPSWRGAEDLVEVEIPRSPFVDRMRREGGKCKG